mmetsp:Transcript_11286/g.34544  ORF Transcript_11286/g.34544 Transcript_11286/m.34544 type:complete len:219 (-) Transcript_11286:232-888(-)
MFCTSPSTSNTFPILAVMQDSVSARSRRYGASMTASAISKYSGLASRFDAEMEILVPVVSGLLPKAGRSRKLSRLNWLQLEINLSRTTFLLPLLSDARVSVISTSGRGYMPKSARSSSGSMSRYLQVERGNLVRTIDNSLLTPCSSKLTSTSAPAKICDRIFSTLSFSVVPPTSMARSQSFNAKFRRPVPPEEASVLVTLYWVSSSSNLLFTTFIASS